MQKITDPAQVNTIADLAIREFVQSRLRQLFSDVPYDPDEYGYFIVVEPGDTVAELEAETGWPILDDPFYESLEEHDAFYEMLFITTDDGFGITLFVPKAENISGDLLVMCRSQATPPVTT